MACVLWGAHLPVTLNEGWGWQWLPYPPWIQGDSNTSLGRWPAFFTIPASGTPSTSPSCA